MIGLATDETRLGRYRLRARLAQGGMAELFLALQEGPAGFEKEVVIKRILPELREDPRFVAMFLDEARIAAQLSHPNIVQLTDFGEVNGTWFLCMERLVGLNLSQILRAYRKARRPFPIPIAAMIVSAVCDGLHYAHTRADEQGQAYGIIHRDVSPSNLFVTYQGAVKVLDFGIAKARSQTFLSQAGQIKGKFHYMSPEQVLGRDLDARSDVFSIGVVLFELLTGVRPFTADETPALIQAVAAGRVDAPGTLRVDLPPELGAIVLRALAPDRARRFGSAAELRGALEDYLSGRESPSPAVALQHFMRELAEGLEGPPAEPATRILPPSLPRAEAGMGGRRAEKTAPPVLEPTRTREPSSREPLPSGRTGAGSAPRPVPGRAIGAWLIATAVCLGMVALAGLLSRHVGAIARLALAPPPAAAPEVPRPVLPPAPEPTPLPAPPAEALPPAVPRLERKVTAEKKPPERRVVPPRSGARRTSPPDAAPGLLSVGCEPQDCHVYLDGEDLHRDTPIFNLVLPPGAHEVGVVQSETGTRRTKRIEVSAAKPAKVLFQF